MENEEFKLPYITVKNTAVGSKNPTLVKALFKLKIVDLLEIPFNEENNEFMFKNKPVNLVMFGGKIENIYRDGSLFSFRVQNYYFKFVVNDGTGGIQCYYKYKEDTDLMIDKMKTLLNSKSCLVNESSCSQLEDVTMFNSTGNDTVLDSYDVESEDAIKEVSLWFTNEVVAKQKIKDIDDIIHVSGHMCESDSVRKVNVIDFRIVENEEEHQDFFLELDYLYKCLY